MFFLVSVFRCQGARPCAPTGVRGSGGGGDVAVEDVVVAVVPGPGEQGQDDLLGNEAFGLVATALDVAVQVHVGMGHLSGIGDAPDHLQGLGQFFLFGHGGFPVVGDFLGQPAEAIDGKLFGELALHGVYLVTDLGEGHGVNSFFVYPRRGTKGHEVV